MIQYDQNSHDLAKQHQVMESLGTFNRLFSTQLSCSSRPLNLLNSQKWIATRLPIQIPNKTVNVKCFQFFVVFNP